MAYKTIEIPDNYILDIPDGIEPIEGALYGIIKDPRNPDNGLKLCFMGYAATESSLK